MVRSIALSILMMLLPLSGQVAAQETLSPLARSIQDDLSRLDSRAGVRADNRFESDRLQRSPRERGQAQLFEPRKLRSPQDISLSSDLGAAQQDLRTLKTSEPDAASIPILERQYDRISREAGANLYQPSRDPAALYAR